MRLYLKARLGTVGLLGLIALLCALPAGAAARVTPQDNSAVNQYTESFPTAQGPKQSNRAKENQDDKSPGSVIGRGNARRLSEQGAVGRAAAEAAAATAPGGVAGATADKAKKGRTGAPSGGASAEADVEGSSGLGEVLGEATGTSSTGELGLALPLIIIATLALSLAYAWRRMRRTV
jgi:cytoskeletal protein RodZ